MSGAPSTDAVRDADPELDGPVRVDLTSDDDDPTPDGNEGADDATNAPCAAYPLAARVEALLMGSDRPLAESRLVELLGIPSSGAAAVLAEAVESLNAGYTESGRAIEIVRHAGGWQVMTRPEFGDLLGRLHRARQQTRLSQAALETLAIVAYRQPIIRAEIEAIRGVACGEVLRGLMERRLVRIAGRAEELGRPMLYGTTSSFLEIFGLGSLDDLPAVDGLESRRELQARRRREAKEAEARAEPATTPDDDEVEVEAPVDVAEAPDESPDDGGGERERSS